MLLPVTLRAPATTDGSLPCVYSSRRMSSIAKGAESSRVGQAESSDALVGALEQLTVNSGEESDESIQLDAKAEEVPHGFLNDALPPGEEVGDHNSRVGVVYDKRMMDHVAPEDHPEQPVRIERIWTAFQEENVLPTCRRLPSREATVEELKRVHPQRHIDNISDCFHGLNDVRKEIAQGTIAKHGYHHRIDSDTYDGPNSGLAARLAAGSVMSLTEAVLEERVQSGFAVVRPPGHHCETEQAQGFCLFNTVAVAARHAQATSSKAKKVLILDWDVHHGYGTQDIFLNDPSVLFISLHRSDGGKFYPGTGMAKEIGKRDGKGYTVNIPWPCRGLGDKEYVVAFEAIVMPLCRQFEPDIVFVSAGFDAALGDPLGGMQVTPEGYAFMTQQLMTLAGGKVVIALEGGYNLTSISNSSVACAKTLLGEPVEGLDELNKFAALPRTGWAEALDSRALRALNIIMGIQEELWRGRHEENPFRHGPMALPSRTRAGAKKESSDDSGGKTISLAEAFAQRKQHRNKGVSKKDAKKEKAASRAAKKNSVNKKSS